MSSTMLSSPPTSSSSAPMDTQLSSTAAAAAAVTTDMTTDDTIVERILEILSLDKLKPWFDTGLKQEYERRFSHRLPVDWIRILEKCGSDLIEVTVQKYSNGSKTFIQLPIKKVRNSTGNLPASPVSQSSLAKSLTIVGKNGDTKIPMTPIRMTPSVVNTQSPVPELSPNNKSGLMTATAAVAAATTASDNRKVQNGSQSVPKDRMITTGTTDQVVIEPPKQQQQVNTKTNGQLNGSIGGVVNNSGHTNGHTSHSSGDTYTSDNVLSGGRPIPPPLLPDVNPEEYFDIFVLLSATPKNFIVVPFANTAHNSPFQKLKSKMLDFYDNVDNHIDLTAELIVNGIYIATKARDEWFRAQVKSVISRDPFQVITYLVDYGEHLTVDIKDIQPLYTMFRELPAQALRASLAGVQPIGTDWDVMTSFEFRKMVEKKPFVSTVQSIDQLDGQPVLSLSLCDTTGSEDLYIGSILVDKGFAKKQ
ncbi:uncharacterized protein LOC128957195 [Oppia nitens]|uniref:uncharacterized protein LOC128957195 n=1 Tax=Oppia nitens TaxID=1686743 RepID=UPI0023DAA0AE|nr:uncharacterized protein LOC128957195 [Oppia nitens]